MIRYLYLCLAALSFAANAQPLLYEEHYDEVVLIGERRFATEIAATLGELQKGMMHRPSMRDDQAMLFIYPHPQRLTFWMKNTLIPLDMLFFDEHGILLEIKQNVPPCKTPRCPTYPSRHDNIKYVVELNGGAGERLDIKAGDQLSYYAP